MEDFSEAKIISALDIIIEYLGEVKPLIDSHTVLFFTEQYWSKLVPSSIQREFERVGSEEFSSAFWNCVSDGVECGKSAEEGSSLVEFLTAARRMSACSLGRDVVLTCRQLKERLSVASGNGGGGGGGPRSECFMSLKKTHEVEVMGEVVSMLAAASGSSHVVDVGGGKGYLSSSLAMHHGLSVLGVDCSPGNTSGAARHSHKLQKAWGAGRGQMMRSKAAAAAAKNTTAEESRYKLATVFVSADVCLSRLVREHFAASWDCRVCVVGLHTCGDLAPSSLRAFAADERAVALCGVGCCYNLLREDGFPLSLHLRRSGFTLGRNARMLAAQAVDRVADAGQKGVQLLLWLSSRRSVRCGGQLAVDAVFYRALLEVLLVESCGGASWGHVGRLAAKCSSFHEYVHKALARLGITAQVSEALIQMVHERYYPKKGRLQAFLALRVAVAPVVETVLLLDRLLFLHELGHHKTCLVQLFDPVLSPRCYGIISLKRS